MNIGSVENDRFEVKFTLNNWNPLDRELKKDELENLHRIIEEKRYNLKLDNRYLIGSEDEVEKLYDETRNSFGRHAGGMYLVNKITGTVYKDKEI